MAVRKFSSASLFYGMPLLKIYATFGTVSIGIASMALPAFVHRRNETGSYDSICSRCATTIVCALEEQSLSSGEIQHLCDEHMLKKRAERVEWYHTHRDCGMYSQSALRHSA